MRRKAVPCFIALTAGIITAFGSKAGWLCLLLFAVSLVSAIWAFKSKRSFAVIIMFFMCGTMLMYAAMHNGIPKTGQAVIKGIVTDVDKKADDYYRITVEHDKGSTLISCYSKVDNAEKLIGHCIRASGILEAPKPATNPGCFDYRLYLKTKKIDTVMTCESITVGGLVRRVPNALACIRADFKQEIERVAGNDQGQIITAMLFGDKSSMDDELYESFQRNGTAHVLAVSGLHIGMIYALFCTIFSGRRKIHTNVIIAGLLIAYAALAGFSPSVMRAVIMILMHIASKLMHYRYDLVSAGCVSGIIMLIHNPYSIFGTGFIMSYLAIFIIGFFVPLAEKLHINEGIKNLLLTPVVVQIGMAPVTAYMFNYFSLISVPANLPVVFLAGLIVPFGVILLMVSVFFPFLMEAGGGVLGTIAGFMVKINDLFYMEGKTSFDVASPSLSFVLIAYGLAFFAASEWAQIKWHRGMKKQWVMTALVVAVICSFAGWRFGNDFDDCECVFVDVGQGSCIHLRTPCGNDFLFDGGGKPDFGKKKDDGRRGFDVGEKILRPYLLKNGVRKVDVAFVTHLDADHYKGIASICRLGMVKQLGLHECLRSEEEKVMKDTGMKREDIAYITTGQTIKTKGFEMKILAPDEGSTSEGSNSDNENSMVAKAKWKDLSVLITGDVDEGAERTLISSNDPDDMDVDVIAVPHHGSKYGSTEELIEAASPKAAVIQVGKNSYGHPAPSIIERYKAAGVRVFRNDEQGAVGIDGQNVKTVMEEE